MGIAAYHAGWPLLLTWHSGFTALHYNTAVLLLLAGGALAASLAGRRVLGCGLALLVAALAAVIGSNEFFSLHLGLDSALFPMLATVPAIGITRVAPNTAAALLLAGLGILFLSAAGRSPATAFRWHGAVSSAMGVVVTVIAATALFGYAFSFSGAYRWREYTAMSLPAAATLALLGCGVLSAGRIQMRRLGRRGPLLLTTSLAVALPTAALLVWQALDWQRDRTNPQSVLPEIVLLISLATSALAVLSLWLAQVAQERRKALERSRESVSAEQRRLHTVLDMLPAYVVLLSPDYHVPFANQFFEERFGKAEGRRCYEYLFHLDSPCENCETFTVAKTRAYHHWEWVGPDGRNYDIHDFPFTDHDGSPLIMEMGLDVTEQKLAESKLRESEERYRSLAVATAQVVWTTNARGLVCGEMPMWSEFTGRTTEELQGWGWIEDVHPDDRERTAQVWKRATESRAQYETEYRLRRKDGEYRNVVVRGVPVLEADGSVREWVGTCTDVTESKRAEARLRQQAALLDLAHDAIFVRDMQSRIKYWNRGARETYGWTAEEARDRCSHELLRTAFRVPLEEIMDAVEGTGQWEGELTHFTSTGAEVIVASRWSLLRDETGRASAVLEINRDITDRKRAAEAVARERERFLSVLDHLPVMVCLLTPDYHLSFANRTFRKRFGEAQGRHCYEYCYGKDAPCDFCESYRVLQTHEAHDWEIVTSAGEHIHAFDFPFTDTDGSPLILEMDMDVTEQRAAEQRLKQYAAELERSNAELQDFASIASHDLQEPLRKVLAFGDRLREQCGAGLDETGQDYLRRMQNAATRMAQLIQSLLEYSRVASRAQPFERVDLAQVMFEVVGDLEERVSETGAKLKWDVLPVVNADRTQMRQLLQNLLANALKFQSPGQRPEVAITAQRLDSAGAWEISVKDNGIGFEEAYAERIFRPFQRLHARQEYAGSGMGLAICRKIVQRHGGTLVARSAPGAGSTFVITLPAQATERNEPWSGDKSVSSSLPKTTTTITC